ncbi:MAG: HAD family hydrolase [Chloroflexota bacterium]
MTVVRALLFDFFGTLVAYSPSRTEQGYERTHRLLAERGVDIAYSDFLDHWVAASEELDRWSAAEGREYGMPQVAEGFLRRVGRDGADEALSGSLWRSYLDEWNVGVRHDPRVAPFIRDLANRYPLGVVTNTHHAPLVWGHLRAMGLDEVFRTVVTSVEVGRPKPHRAVFDAAVEAIGVPAGETMYVGDSYVADYLGATRAGLRALLIDPRRESPVPARDRLGDVFGATAWLDRHMGNESAGASHATEARGRVP